MILSLQGPTLWALLIMVAGLPPSSQATDVLPQTLLVPRHPERPVVYGPASEIPSSHATIHENSENPNHAPPRLWKQARSADGDDGEVSDTVQRYRYDWHLHVDAEWEAWWAARAKEGESRRRQSHSPPSPLEQDTHATTPPRAGPNLARRLWNRVSPTMASWASRRLGKEKSATSQAATTNAGKRDSHRRDRDEPQQETEASSSNASGYEVVNQQEGGDETDDTDDGGNLNLYPYVDINNTDSNTSSTDDETYTSPDDGLATAEDTPESDNNDGEDQSSPDDGNNTTTGSPPRRFAPLRVRAILTDALEEVTGDAVLNATERRSLLVDTVRPAMVAWGKALRVRRVKGNLTLDPNQLMQGEFCGPGPSVKVPAEHTTTGIPETDFVLYLHVARRSDYMGSDEPDEGNTTDWDLGYNETLDNDDSTNTTDFVEEGQQGPRKGKPRDAKDEERASEAPTSALVDTAYLCSGDYIAASAFCNTDQYDRPIAAILHLCLDDDFFEPNRADLNIRTVMHELGHSLGFNAISLAHFRRFDGTPRTPRLASGAVPLQKVLCTGPQEPKPSRFDRLSPEDTTRHDGDPLDRLLRLGQGDAGEDTDYLAQLQQNSSGTKELTGYYDRIPLPSPEVLQFRTVRGGVRVAQVVTPSVLQVTRNHFGCETLMGAELESGESVCLGDHWERRLFKTDLMNPIIDSDTPFIPRISTITLAYFADSGWYQVDLSRASVAASWGRGAGCPFVDEPCIGQDGQVSPGLDSLFCSSQTIGMLTLDGCTHDLLKKASCRLDQYTDQLPQAYQYFDSTYGSNVGGPDPYIDYCPVYAGFGNGMCSDRSNEAFIKVSPMERVGSRNSRCLAGTLPYGKTALCLRIACVVNDKSLRVQVDRTWYTCTHQGQKIHTRLGVKVECPDPVRTCPTFYCPRDCLGSPELICDYGQGECVCPVNRTLPLADGSCPPVPGNDTNTDGGDGDPASVAEDNASGRPSSHDDPFYRPPVLDDESAIPEDDAFIQAIYFPDERALIEHDEEEQREEGSVPNRWRLPVVSAAAILVASALVILFVGRSRKRRHGLPITTLDFPGNDDDPDISPPTRPQTSSRRSEKMKMMATVVVDLRLQEQFSDVFVQDTNTDAASMTDTEGDQSFTAPPTPPRMPEEYLRPTIVHIPPPQPLEIDIPVPRSAVRRRLRRRFL